MTQFNPLNKETMTYGDSLGPAMKIKDPADAQQYLADYVAYIREGIKRANSEPRKDGKSAEEIALDNLGYYAGYYDNETRERVERLFKCQHPVFGSIAENGAPTAEEAFAAGMRLGRQHQKMQA
jgi:hypothetical protein